MTSPTKKAWGGARPGAGRPRTRPERLTATEVGLLLDMLRGSLSADQHPGLTQKLERLEEAAKISSAEAVTPRSGTR